MVPLTNTTTLPTQIFETAMIKQLWFQHLIRKKKIKKIPKQRYLYALHLQFLVIRSRRKIGVLFCCSFEHPADDARLKFLFIQKNCFVHLLEMVKGFQKTLPYLVSPIHRFWEIGTTRPPPLHCHFNGGESLMCKCAGFWRGNIQRNCGKRKRCANFDESQI